MLNKPQIEAISKFFADLAKILFATAVVGFFIPTSENVSVIAFISGGLLASVLFISSVAMLKQNYD